MAESIWDVKLTDAEQKIIHWLSQGLDRVPAIAERLGVDEREVRSQVERLLHRLRVASLAELTAYVKRNPPRLNRGATVGRPAPPSGKTPGGPDSGRSTPTR